MADKLNDEVIATLGTQAVCISDPELAAALARAYEIHKTIRALEPERLLARGLIARRAAELLKDEQGTVTFKVGALAITVNRRQETLIPEDNVTEVRRLLGRRFSELVRTRRAYVGRPALLEQAGARLRALLRFRQLSPRFTWVTRL